MSDTPTTPAPRRESPEELLKLAARMERPGAREIGNDIEWNSIKLVRLLHQAAEDAAWRAAHEGDTAKIAEQAAEIERANETARHALAAQSADQLRLAAIHAELCETYTEISRLEAALAEAKDCIWRGHRWGMNGWAGYSAREAIKAGEDAQRILGMNPPQPEMVWCDNCAAMKPLDPCWHGGHTVRKNAPAPGAGEGGE